VIAARREQAGGGREDALSCRGILMVYRHRATLAAEGTPG
jgi:hypothetical protein